MMKQPNANYLQMIEEQALVITIGQEVLKSIIWKTHVFVSIPPVHMSELRTPIQLTQILLRPTAYPQARLVKKCAMITDISCVGHMPSTLATVSVSCRVMIPSVQVPHSVRSGLVSCTTNGNVQSYLP